MKIKSLTIKNINSWKGEHKIDFQQVLKGETLFAITGPTGSGKSTILLAISLALYGEGPKGLNAHDYITLGEKEGSVSLDLLIKGKSITANWAIKHGQKQAKRSVLIDGEVAPRPASIIEEIIGLKFDQFNKTIILNQGDFSKFLTSKFSERKAILEHLAGIEELTKLNDVIKIKRTRAINEKEKSFSAYSSFTEVGPEDINNLEIELSKIETDYLFAKQKVENLQDNSKHIKSYFEFVDSYQKLQERILVIEKNIKELLPNLQKNKEIQNQIVKDLQKIKDEFNKIKPELLEALGDEKAIQLSLAQIEENKKKIKKTLDALNNNQENIKALNVKQRLLDIEKEKNKTPLSTMDHSRKQELQPLLNEILIKKQRLFNFKSQKAELELELQKGFNKSNELSEKLTQLKSSIDIDENYDLAELESKLKNLLEENGLLIAKHNHALRIEKEIISTTEQLRNITNEFELKKIIYDKFETDKNEKDLANAINLVAKESIKANKCLICDSGDVNHIHEVETVLIDESEYLKAKEQFNQLNLEVHKMRGKLEDYQKDLLGYGGISLEMLKSVENKIASIQNKIKNIKIFEKEYLPIHKSLEINFENNEKLKQQIENLNIQIENCSKEVDILFNNLSHLTGMQKTEQLEIKVQEYMRLDQNLQKIESDYKSLVVEKELKENELTNQKEEIESINFQLSQLQASIQQKEQKIFQITKGQKASIVIKEFEDKIENFQQSIEKLTGSINELERKRNYEEAMLQTEKFNLESHTLKITEAKLKISFALNNSIQSNYIDSSVINIQKMLIPTQEWDASIVREVFELVYVPYVDKSKKEEEQLLERRGELKNQIKRLKEDIEKAKELKSIFEQHSKQADLYEELYQLIVKQDFRGHVLSFIEESLIEMANHEISELCDDRYKLFQHKDLEKNQVDFLISDSLHAGETRKISTLSGGETFLISLGLALALSEMMRGKTDIDSFFIDEGFGTLDPDSIDDVLSILMSVQNRGKTIGLISHVKSLTSRIPVNIELHQNINGTDYSIVRN